MSKLNRINKLITEVRNQCNALQTLETGDILSDEAFRAVLKVMPHLSDRRESLMWRWHELDRMKIRLQNKIA